jgi:predicted nucleic acid-binding protein
VIVADASAVVDLLLDRPNGVALQRALARHPVAHAPHLIDPEVLQALRRLMLHGGLAERRAREAIDDFVALPIVRHAHVPLHDRVWALRDRFTAYDAAYVALAELFEAEFVTTDAALARSAKSLVAVAE